MTRFKKLFIIILITQFLIIQPTSAAPFVTHTPPNDSVEVASSGTYLLSYWTGNDGGEGYNSFTVYRDDNSGFTSQEAITSYEWTGPTDQITAFQSKRAGGGITLGNWYYRIRFWTDLPSSVYSIATVITWTDTTNPVLSNPTTPITMEVGASRTLSWSWTDNWEANSGAIWRIYRNSICSGTIETSGTWNGGSGSKNHVVSPTVDTTYAMCVWDSESNGPDLDAIFVDTTAAANPVVNAPSDQTMEVDASRTIGWTWTDNFDNPTDTGDWVVRSQSTAFSTCTTGTIVNSGTWSSTAGSRDEVVSPTSNIFYCIRVTDDANNFDDDFVDFTVTSASNPVLNAPSDTDILEPDTSRTIYWTWTDNFDNPTTDWTTYYQSSDTGTCGTGGWSLLNSGTWSSTAGSRDEVVSPTVDTYYCIWVEDDALHDDYDTVFVDVFLPQENPSINSPSDLTMEDGSSTRNIDWSWTDNFDNPTDTGDYEIRYQTTTPFGSCTGGSAGPSGLWSSTAGSYDYTGLSPTQTTYYCIKVTDEGLNSVEDFVTITVTTSQIPVLNSPSDITKEVSSSRTIYWTWTDNFDNPTDTGDFWVRSDNDYSGTCDSTQYPTLEFNDFWSSTAGSRNEVETITSTRYYCIHVQDETGNNDYDFVTITVTPAQIPDVNSPSDYTIEIGATRTIYWSWTDNFQNPTDTGTIEVRSTTTGGPVLDCVVAHFPTVVYSSTWTGNSGNRDEIVSPTVSITYCIKLVDEGTNEAMDFVGVTVISNVDPQFTSSPNDFSYEYLNVSTINIQWSFSDNVNGSTWNIKRSTDNSSWGGVLSNGVWNSASGSSDLYDVGSQTTDYYYRIEIIDEVSNNVYDYVRIGIHAKTEIQDYIINQVGNDINEKAILQFWSYHLHTLSNYEVYRNGSLIDSGSYTNGTYLYVYFVNDGLLVDGIYNLTILVWDAQNDLSTFQSLVDYIDTSPFIYLIPNDVSINIYSTGNLLQWAAIDLFSNTYQIYINSSLTVSGLWSEGIFIYYNFDSLAGGFVYEFELRVFDNRGNMDNDFVFVTVSFDNESPIFIGSPDNYLFAFSSTGNELTWVISDISTGNYILYQNGSNVDSGSWVNVLIIGIDGLGLNVYNFTLVIIDLYGNQAIDQVWVRVISDDGNPQIIISTSDFGYLEGSTDNIIIWGFVDNHPDYFIITRNSTEILNTSWENGNLLILDIDGLSAGVYVFDLTVYDTSGNSSTDQVIITIT